MTSYDLDHLEDDELLFELNLRGIDRDNTNAREMLRNRMVIENVGDIAWNDTVRVIRSVTSEVSLLSGKFDSIVQSILEANESENFDRVNELTSRINHVFNRISRLNAGKGEMQSVMDLVREMSKAAKSLKLVQHSLGASGLEVHGGSSAPNGTPTSIASRSIAETVAGNRPQRRPSGLALVNNTASTLPMTDQPLERGKQEFLSSLFHRSSMPFVDPGIVSAGQPIEQDPYQQNPFQHTQPQQIHHQHRQPPIPHQQIYHQQFPQHQVPHQQVRQPNQQMPEHVSTRALGQPMSKWRIRFGGVDGELAIDEFLFRVENLAMADGIPQASLVLGLHFLLVGSASTFYWVCRRMKPHGTWQEYRQDFLEQFSTVIFSNTKSNQ